MWHVMRDLLIEELRRLWRRATFRPEPETPFAAVRVPPAESEVDPDERKVADRA